MHRESENKAISRRQLLQGGGVLAGSAILAQLFPASLSARVRAAGAVPRFAPLQAAAKSPAEVLAEMRAQMGAAPIMPTKLADNLMLLSGPGGNVVVLHGPDGKIVVDSFVQPAWPKL